MAHIHSSKRSLHKAGSEMELQQSLSQADIDHSTRTEKRLTYHQMLADTLKQQKKYVSPLSELGSWLL